MKQEKQESTNPKPLVMNTLHSTAKDKKAALTLKSPTSSSIGHEDGKVGKKPTPSSFEDS